MSLTLEEASLFLTLFFLFLALLQRAAKQQSSTTVRSRTRRKQQQGAADHDAAVNNDGGRRLVPPSPPGLPLIGHLHLVGFLPHVSLRDLATKYGSRDGLMLVRLGAVPTLVVSTPHAAEAVMRTHDHLLASRPPSTAAHALLHGSLDVMFAAHGDQWRQGKKLLTTHLLTTKKVQSYRSARQEEVRIAVARIRDTAAVGGAVDMSELLCALTSDLMCRAVSDRFFDINGRSRLFRELVEDTAALIGGFNLVDYFPWLLRFGVFRRAVCARAGMVRKRWDQQLDRVLDNHEDKVVQQHRPDLIQLILSQQEQYGLNRDHVKAILIDIIFGGTDTSYLVLEFIMAELIKNPGVMFRLQAELRSSIPKGHEMVSEDDLAGMSYLKAVVKEGLRLHPPAPLLAPHFSMADVQIHGYTVPANTPILVNAWALGRDASIWENAEEFKPERFIDNGSDVNVNFKGNDFQFLPFGAGRRICPGINFSIATIEIVLANLIYCFNWELPPPMDRIGIDMSEVFYLTVHRKEKLLLVPKSYCT